MRSKACPQTGGRQTRFKFERSLHPILRLLGGARGNLPLSTWSCSEVFRMDPDRRRTPYTGARFIPAYAGNTRPTCGRFSLAAVHPRVCGEHHALSSSVRPSQSVHPRVCGEQLRDLPLSARSESGSSPRVRGTALPSSPDAGLMSGSSPRVRGTTPSARAIARHARFIPACAGNTPVASPSDRIAERFIPACAGNTF